MRKRILIVEDNQQVAEAIVLSLEQAGYTTCVCADGTTAIEQLKSNTFHLVIIDLLLPFTSGMNVIKWSKTEFPTLPIIVLSSIIEENIVTHTFLMGAFDYISKPFKPSDLLQSINKALQQKNWLLYICY